MYPGKGTVVLIRPAQTFYERIKHRHPKEWVFFWLIALLTVAVLLILLPLAIFRTDVIESLRTDYIKDYHAQNPDAANLTD